MENENNENFNKNNLSDFLKDNAEYAENKILVIEELNHRSFPDKGIKNDSYIIAVCLNGKASIHINDNTINLHKNDLFISHPNVILEEALLSIDFKCSGFIISSDYVKQVNIISPQSWDLKVFLDKNPVISLEEEDIEKFLLYFKLFRDNLKKQTKFKKEINGSLLNAFTLEFLLVIEKIKNFKYQSYNSAENMFNNFLELLANSYPRERKVSSYAEKLCITPKYLSFICKNQCGETASKLINRCIVKDIEFLLKRPDKSIKEISNELKFPDLSFFGKYVKANLGMSPKAYREKYARKE